MQNGLKPHPHPVQIDFEDIYRVVLVGILTHSGSQSFNVNCFLISLIAGAITSLVSTHVLICPFL